jgi:hypothetical protein
MKTVYIVVDKPKMWDAETPDSQFALGVIEVFTDKNKAERFRAMHQQEVYPEHKGINQLVVVYAKTVSL